MPMKTLKKGSKGDDVTTLQKALKNLGYGISIDGIFGNNTYLAVVQFQKDNNLAQDGIVGVNTWTVITDLQSNKSIIGIDVSHHNGTINWSRVPQSQVQFVFCKATQGKSFTDDMLHANMNELKRLGFMRGAYHFLTFQGVTAKEQVDNFIGTGIDFSQPGTLPPVLDVEWQQSNSLNQYILQNRQACIKLIKDWLVAVETATGRKPIIYTNKSFWNDYLGNPTGFESYNLWVASYRNDAPSLPVGWTEYAFWQFTEKGSVAGISGMVDKNYFSGNLKRLKTLALL